MTLPTPAQIRAARASLDWSKMELAQAARVSVATVMWAEGRDPERVSAGSWGALRVALETAGLSFIADAGEGAGLRMRPEASRSPRSGGSDLADRA